jgi:nicotinamidase-related amidase
MSVMSTYRIAVSVKIMETHLRQERRALVICDLQADALSSLSVEQRESFLNALKPLLEAARLSNWLVVFSGLRFPSGYAGVDPNHKLFGALARLNGKLGDKAAHWFMNGYAGSETPLNVEDNERVVWRQQHLPHELAELLRNESITHATVTGIALAVQCASQFLVDEAISVSIVRECIADANEKRREAVLEHFLPTYADVTSLNDAISSACGTTREFFDQAGNEARSALVDFASGSDSVSISINYCSDCGRRGHGARFIELLLQRPDWRSYPTQPWYEDMLTGKEYFSPLGKKLVAFCDEPEFSQLSMYIAGREWLDEKDKVLLFATDFMPLTYCFENGCWVDDKKPPDDLEEGSTTSPWFIKEADKNLGGNAISIISKPSLIPGAMKTDRRYVVQQHVKDPLLMDDGRKVHIKFYVLLLCDADGSSWEIFTYKGSLLSISPNRWSPEDLSHDTQITIHRHSEPPARTQGWGRHWPEMYEKCKAGTLTVVQRAVEKGNLKGRRGKRQFEVFSADWMGDTHGNVWLFEFNMSPALCRAFQDFDEVAQGDSADSKRRTELMQHDEKMLRDALAVVLPWDGGEMPGLWDLAGSFPGPEHV